MCTQQAVVTDCMKHCITFIFQDGKSDIDPSANLQTPLANGNIPLTSINISEEVNKTGIWKHVNEGSSAYKDEKKKKSPVKNR